MARPRKYLTLKDWQEWIGNDWKHTTNKLARHEGMLIAILVLLTAIVGMVGLILRG